MSEHETKAAATRASRKKAAAAVSSAGMSEYITVVIEDQLFGIPVPRVHDVFMPQSMTRVPLSAPEVAGVLNLRGRIVTAIDMRRRLGLQSRDRSAGCMAVGVEHRGESYGLIIDSVGEVLRVADADMESNPANLDPRWREISAGVQRLESRLMIVIDVERVLNFTGQTLAA
ncbi:chemotaxis protein CheW [Tepidicaulis sp.]|jgi:purine-binding chemotaxis protein CheW|uniref:chemotaxis protein CheW n=1 Tax=Tepidicaulis sp. TaxID=1920809 RepID=UPI003B5995EC